MCGKSAAGTPCSMEPTKAPWAAGGPSPAPPIPAARAGMLSLGAPRAAHGPVTLTADWPRPLVDAEKASWSAPCKHISSDADLTRFLRSAAAKSFVGFILSINEAVRDKPISTDITCSPAVLAVLDGLAGLSELVDKKPPVQHALRYGNPAYRDWFRIMEEGASDALKPLLPANLQGATSELALYWIDSFGNKTRIDYGTGHETCFVAFLYCLARLGVLGPHDAPAVGLRIFPHYLNLMRRVQTTYWLEPTGSHGVWGLDGVPLEPAGSHGVWGLDDYQCLPFMWGASQLSDHAAFTPASIHKEALLREGAPDYLYFAAISFIRKVKKGPFAEVSPMLNDISGLESWRKVNTGMTKLYQAEVLSKVPIMQHFLFGRLIEYPAG